MSHIYSVCHHQSYVYNNDELYHCEVNLVCQSQKNDLFRKYNLDFDLHRVFSNIFGFFKKGSAANTVKSSQFITLLIGVFAVLLATNMQNVLELMLYSYAFMVSGLLVPVAASLILKKPSSLAAMISMILGGSTTLSLIILNWELPFGLDANFFGILSSFLSFVIVQYYSNLRSVKSEVKRC